MSTPCLPSRPLTSHTTPQAIIGHLGKALALLFVLLLISPPSSAADTTPRVLEPWKYWVHPAWYPMNGAAKDCVKLAEGTWENGACINAQDPLPWSSDKTAAKALAYYADEGAQSVSDGGWLKEGETLSSPYHPCGYQSGFTYDIEYQGIKELIVHFNDGTTGTMCGTRSRNIDCPVDTYPTEAGDCQCPGATCFEDETCPEGNPTLPASGVNIHREDLLASNGVNTLPLSLSYRSRYSGVTNFNLSDGMWLHSYQAAVYSHGTWWNGSFYMSTNATYIARPNGAVYRFEQKDTSSPWTSIETADTLTQTASGWRLKRAEDDATETYNAQGKLLSIQQRNGLKTTLQYNTQNWLTRVTHPYGRTLTFNYDDAGHLTRIDTSGGEHFGLAYDANGNLTTLTYPHGRNRQFHYENAFYPNALTGVTDETGQRIGTYSYAADGRVFETQRANAVDHLRFAYAKDAQGLPQTVVTRYSTEGVPEQQTYNFIVQGHITRPGVLSVPTGQSGYVQNTVYDAKGLKTKHIQQDGRVTFYTRNAKGRITREATYPASYQSATTAPALSQAESVTSTQWHGTWNLPLKVAEAYLITSYSYDSKGNLLELIETPTSDATGAKGFNATPSETTYTTRWTYDAKNLPTTIVELVGSAETGRWNISYDTKGDMVGITHVTSGTVATLVPVGNGTSQVTAITPQASPAVNPAMATVRALGFAKASATAAGEMVFPQGGRIAVPNIIKMCSGFRLSPLGVFIGAVLPTEMGDACDDKPQADECRDDCAQERSACHLICTGQCVDKGLKSGAPACYRKCMRGCLPSKCADNY